MTTPPPLGTAPSPLGRKLPVLWEEAPVPPGAIWGWGQTVTGVLGLSPQGDKALAANPGPALVDLSGGVLGVTSFTFPERL